MAPNRFPQANSWLFLNTGIKKEGVLEMSSQILREYGEKSLNVKRELTVTEQQKLITTIVFLLEPQAILNKSRRSRKYFFLTHRPIIMTPQ